MNPIPARRLVAALLLATTCLCGSLFADQKFDDLRKAAEQGDAKSQCDLGNTYHEGLNNIVRDPVDALKWWKKSADQGYAPAQYKLGNAYSDGYPLKEDLREAVRWYRKAADQGYAPAQHFLGMAYHKADYKLYAVEAYAWVILAAVTDRSAQETRSSFKLGMTAKQIDDGDKRSAVLDAVIKANQAKK